MRIVEHQVLRGVTGGQLIPAGDFANARRANAANLYELPTGHAKVSINNCGSDDNRIRVTPAGSPPITASYTINPEGGITFYDFYKLASNPPQLKPLTDAIMQSQVCNIFTRAITNASGFGNPSLQGGLTRFTPPSVDS
jgi:hypothetical protein